MFAFNKVVSHFAVAISNKMMLKVKNVAFLCVFATKRGGNSILCTQIFEASSREHVSIQQHHIHIPSFTWIKKSIKLMNPFR